jgi:hypothetical protein
VESSPLETIRRLFGEMMGWQGSALDIVDFACAAYISPFLPGEGRERTWGIVVGQPSSGKTELLRMFLDYDPAVEAPRRTVIQDDLTENALVSGFRSEEDPDYDPSLLARLDSRRAPVGPKVLVVKEMGPILGLPKERRSRFFHQMRKAFDGDYNHGSGSVGTVYYKLGFGFLGAATEAVDDAKKQDQPLGERIVLCRMSQGATDWDARESRIDNATTSCPIKKGILREKIRTTFVAAADVVIRHLAETPDYAVHQPEDIRKRLNMLANLVTIIRTVPISNQTKASAPEEGMRYALQLQTWADSLATFDNRTEWNERDYTLMRRLSRDTLPPDFLRVMLFLWGKKGADCNMTKPSELIRLRSKSGDSIGEQLSQWTLSGLLWESTTGSFGLTPQASKRFAATKFFEGVDFDEVLGYNGA